MRRKIERLLSGLALLVCTAAVAHEPGLSSARLVPDIAGLTLTLIYAPGDIEAAVPLDADRDAEISTQEMEAGKPLIARIVAARVIVKQGAAILVPAAPAEVDYEPNNNIRIVLRYPSDDAGMVTYRSEMFQVLPQGHREFVAFKDVEGRTLGEKVLVRDDPEFAAARSGNASGEAGASAGATFVGFLRLGMEHILAGYDHLLFLFALLLVCRTLRAAAAVITCFTLAHSVTLALATLGIVEMPDRVVEPLIAASIVYVGTENILKGEMVRARWLLTFVFGLVHGFGFAGALREMEIGSGQSGLVLPLLAFNLGIELTQIAIAAVLLSVLWRLRDHAAIRTIRWVPACSFLISLMGGYWFVERVFFVS